MSATAEPADRSPMTLQAFTRGMAHYCTTYYTLLAEAEETYPEMNPSSDGLFEGAAGHASEDAEVVLAALRPPASLAAPFKRFVTLTHEITEAHYAMARSFVSTREEGPGGDDYDHAVAARRPLAPVLHAPICDGKLPADQQAAVIEAVRTVETSRDSKEVCAERVTPGFLQYTWASSSDPVAACIATRGLTLASLPTGIDVDQVTGSDGITATVDYHEVGGCTCGSFAQARVHMVDGVWKVSSISY